MTTRKFYRTVIEVEILSEEPLNDVKNLDAVYYDITWGDCSGAINVTATETVNGAQIAKLLNAQGSDFFQVDEHGNDIS